MRRSMRIAVPMVALAVALGLSSPALAQAVCGDGALAAGEACDDGDLVGLDGCSAACTIEAGWTCGCATPKFTYVDDALAGVIGGQGGGEGPQMGCGEREVLIGLRFDFSNGTKTATRTTVFCGEVVVAANGTVTTTEKTSQTDGGSGCAGWDPSTQTPKVLCPSGWAVVGVNGRRSDVPIANSLFHSVSVVCGRLGVDGRPTGETQELPIPGMTGTTDGVPQTAACPAGKIGRYFQTRRGCGQDGLWLYCSSPVVDCTGQPSYCAAVSCGDGLLAGAELCDDGNTMPLDGCDGSCKPESGWECGCKAPVFTYSADASAGLLGGSGGDVGPKMGCTDREVLIGLRFDFSNGTKTVTRTTTFCGEVAVTAGGVVTTEPTTNATSGGTGCSGWDPSTVTPAAYCPTGWAVVGLRGYKAGETLFHSVSLVCGRLGVDGKPTGETAVVPVAGMAGASVAQPQVVDCPAGTIGRYFQTRAACGQDALEMFCSVPAVSCGSQGSVCSAICGDGKVQGGETCDDANAIPGDGCDGTCTVETGWKCTNDPATSCAAICGDGLVKGPETCDDGGIQDGDGCSGTCAKETGWTCPTPGAACQTICGDGLIKGDEVCDDGDTTGGDGCSATCTPEEGWACGCAAPRFVFVDDAKAGQLGGDGGEPGTKMGCTEREVLIGLAFDFSDETDTVTRTTVICGEVQVAAGGVIETVETGSQTSGGTGCSGWDPSTATPKTLCPSGWAVIGLRGYKANAETLFHSVSLVCGRLGVDGLPTGDVTFVAVEGTAGASTEFPQAVDCPAGTIGRWFQTRFGCGQDALDLYCSAPAVDCADQASVCRAVCGDGVLNGSEGCDDANGASGDGCSGTCEVEEGWECKSQGSNCAPICGDGLVRGDEECDDGDKNGDDGCNGSCKVEPGWVCLTPGEPCGTDCGDGLIRGDEECDDGNEVAGDGCSAACAVEEGFTCPTPNEPCQATCGDGLIRGQEQCDDQNTDAGDGCSDACVVEEGWHCEGEPSLCSQVVPEPPPESTPEPQPEPAAEPAPEPAPEAIPETVVAEPRPDALEEAAAPDAQPSYDYVPSKDLAVAEGVGGFSGGAMCSSGAEPTSGGLAGALGLAFLFVAFVFATRARRRLVPLAAAIVPLLVPAGAEARPIDLDRFRPAEAARDGLALSSAETPGHLCYDVLLHFDYAWNPLVWETSLGDSSTESHSIVEHLAVGRLTGSITFVERLLLYGGLSFVAIQKEGDGATPAGAVSADGEGLGDAWIGLRARLLGTEKDVFMLAAQLGTTIPLAEASNANQSYRGEGQWTIDPKLVGQFNLGPARLLLNVGVRARPGQGDSAPSFGHELTLGAGAGVWLAKKRVMLAAEVTSALAFEDFGGREASSLELLAGAKYFSRLGVMAGLGLGTGLARGVGSPDVRALAMLGWAPSCGDAPPPKPACDADPDKDGVCSPCVAAQGRQAEFASVCSGDDKCPAEAEDKDAFEDADGCPDPDNDKDGILDTADDCPLEPEDKDGFMDDDGCPEDGPLPAVQPFGRLGDDDSTEPLKTVRIGCKEIKADWSVFFETGKAEIMPQSKADLEQVVETLTATPDIRKVRVEGHTDSKGNPKSNLKLSDARAQSVRDYLVSRGIDAARLESKGYGQTKPVASNKTDEGRAKNRRVVFAIVQRDKACDKDVPPGCEEFTFRGHVNFETASAKLKASSFPTLDKLAELLREARFAKLIEVSGHTDAVGKRDYNRKLSADRAISVREYLVGKGVDAAVLKALGYGYDRPIADNATAEGRLQNRRVEFVVLEKADACVPKAK